MQWGRGCVSANPVNEVAGAQRWGCFTHPALVLERRGAGCRAKQRQNASMLRRCGASAVMPRRSWCTAVAVQMRTHAHRVVPGVIPSPQSEENAHPCAQGSPTKGSGRSASAPAKCGGASRSFAVSMPLFFGRPHQVLRRGLAGQPADRRRASQAGFLQVHHSGVAGFAFHLGALRGF